jgi:hypothetical protein
VGVKSRLALNDHALRPVAALCRSRPAYRNPPFGRNLVLE